MAKRKETDWDGERLDRLATFYLEVRAVMWTQLGDMMGEKWDVVEKIVSIDTPRDKFRMSQCNSQGSACSRA